MGKKSKKSLKASPVARWHKTYIKWIRKRFGQSKYQMLWITIGGMDSTQKFVEKLVERRIQNTGESQAVATANVQAAFQKLKKHEA